MIQICWVWFWVVRWFCVCLCRGGFGGCSCVGVVLVGLALFSGLRCCFDVVLG